MNQGQARRVEERPQIANLEAEKWVLGLCLLDPTGDALDETLAVLKPPDFSLAKHQHIFSALAHLRAAGEGVDQVTISQKLIEHGTLEKAGGAAYISSLTDCLPLIEVGPKLKMVRWFSRRRTIGTWARQVELACMDPATTPEGLAILLEPPEEAHGGEEAIQPIGGVVRERLAEIRNAASAPGKLPGWTTTIPDVDTATTGIRPTELWVVGAIPSAGKTSLLAQIVLANAKAGVPVGIFSAEMSAKNLVDRLLSMDSRIVLPKFRDPRMLTPADLDNLSTHCGEMVGLPIMFDESAGIDLTTLRARARLMSRKYGCRLFGVDYLQLIEGPGDNRHERIGAVARGLKNLAKDLDAGVVMASQLSRPQKGTMAPPTMLDLKESGDIEAAADAVILIHRPFVLSHKPSDRERDVLIIAKQRNGPVGDIRVVFDDAYTRFLPGGALA